MFASARLHYEINGIRIIRALADCALTLGLDQLDAEPGSDPPGYVLLDLQ